MIFIYLFLLFQLTALPPEIPIQQPRPREGRNFPNIFFSLILSKEQLSTKKRNPIETNAPRISVNPAATHLELPVPYRATTECILTLTWNLPTRHGSRKCSLSVPPKDKSTTVSSYHLKTRLIYTNPTDSLSSILIGSKGLRPVIIHDTVCAWTSLNWPHSSSLLQLLHTSESLQLKPFTFLNTSL